jgi:hypothetical protein
MIRKIGMISFFIAAFLFVALTMSWFDRSFSTVLRRFLWITATFGLILFSVHYLTQAPQDRKKTPFYVRVIHFFSLTLIALGLLFKIMHWPFTSILIILGFIGSGISFILEKNEIKTSTNSDLIDSE